MWNFIVKNRVYIIWILLVAIAAVAKGYFLKKALWNPAPAPAAAPATKPLVVASPDSAILLLPLTKEEAIFCQWVQKGSLVMLCRTDSTEGAKPTDCSGPICIAAAHSNTTQTPGDYLLLQVPLTETWKINSYLAATKRSILLLPSKGK